MATANVTQRENRMFKVDCSDPRLSASVEGLMIRLSTGSDKGHDVTIHLSAAELAEQLSKILNPSKIVRRVVKD